ncbi:hypothetical protein ACFFQF_25740 [Haladaptatus pallidirubidus]|uniref:Uncharacterized protein n=1 Tax=Haladaptatus pallidirubidus TaxID=1008152 RepID=A0AAV3UMY0_9EURY|nr:hypothetical protein [Haladaptatus pallidirubidus]
MRSRTILTLARAVLVGLLLLATPGVAFFLIANALASEAGLVGWLLTVVLPLALFGVGLYLLTGDRPNWLSSVGRRA